MGRRDKRHREKKTPKKKPRKPISFLEVIPVEVIKKVRKPKGVLEDEKE